MKKITVLTAMFCLCLQAVVAVFAATPNFAGNWELDVSKSILPDAMQIESMTLTVDTDGKGIERSNRDEKSARRYGQPNEARRRRQSDGNLQSRR